MKKLLTILILATITLSSCDKPTLHNSDMPSEVVSLKELNKYDTTYVIKSEHKVFVFNNKKEYIGAYNVQNHENKYIVIVFMMLFFILLFAIIVL